MNVPDKDLYEYCIVRYVPDIERGEYVNVGLLMMSKRRKWIRFGMHINKDRIRSLNADADIDVLEQQLGVFSKRDVPYAGLPVEETYRWLCAVKSAILQTSPSHPGLAENHEAEFERLFSRLVM